MASKLRLKIGGRGHQYSSKKVKNEECVLCGCNTEVPVTTPVQERKYYIHGCGQLCENCYYSLGQEGNFVE